MGDFQQFVADVTSRLSAMGTGELYVVGDGLDRDSLSCVPQLGVDIGGGSGL
ncbi:hypothetical protein [Micromonospora sp. WMMD980]|uniref:hypothetical protein n=1 Tax=Micromonospora sp. WMMD980 TaxID=3016088 RepID=UPI00241776BA|nr:hypothetical protein [Micromonospora sp. WMMD980]MDG4801990.1 hypothetical protein [Micromonospora sp. WMMD980]